MTISEIETAVKLRLNRNVDEVNNNVRTWANLRQRLILRPCNFSFLLTAGSATTPVASTRGYGLPNDFKNEATLWLEISDDRIPLEMRTQRELFDHYKTTDEGQTKYYTLTETQYLIFPLPDSGTVSNGEYYLDYYRYLANFGTDDSTTNYLTDNYPDVLIAAMVAEGFSVLGQAKEAILWEQKLALLQDQLMKDDAERQLPMNPILEPNADVYRAPMTGSVI